MVVAETPSQYHYAITETLSPSSALGDAWSRQFGGTVRISMVTMNTNRPAFDMMV
jgi:hypothetical protein